MSRLNSLFGALLLFFLPAAGHAQIPVDTPPEMNVAIFLGTVTERADSKSSAQMSKELSRVFESRGIKHFYQLGVQSLRFEDSKSGVVTLPSGQKAYFDFKGKTDQHHLFALRLPEFGVSAILHVPLNRVFYQAGIQHAGGTLILRIRTRLTE